MDESIKAYSIRRPRTAFVAGALIGTLGGLIGLGGAEFRLPVLIALFALLPHRAVRFNLLVSLVTLAFSCLTRLRLQTGLDAALYVDVAASMIVGGMIAAWFGAGLLSRIPTDRLMSTIAVLLLAIAALLVAEATHLIAAPFELPHDTVVRVSAGLMAGILVGAISSLLGVAGGEFIIPILIFIFGADIRACRQLSQNNTQIMATAARKVLASLS